MDPLLDVQELLVELDPGDEPAANPLSDEDRAAIDRFLELERAELGRTTIDPAR